MLGRLEQVRNVAGKAAKVAAAVLAALGEVAYDVGQAHRVYPLAMYALGWPPPVRYFALHEQVEIARRYQATKDDGAALDELEAWVRDLVLARHDARRLRAMLAEWERKAWLKRRIPILRDAVEAHIGGKYNLSVPPVLSQLEAVVAEGFGHKGVLRHRGRSGKNAATFEEYLGRLLPQDWWNKSDEAVKLFMLEVVLASFEYGQPLPGNLNRHAILHGVDTDYGTVENSLKTILLFDYVQDAFRFVITAGGRSYHLLGCPELSKAKKGRLVFRSESEAMGQRVPCKRCLPDRWEWEAE